MHFRSIFQDPLESNTKLFYKQLTKGLQELHESLGPELITINWLARTVDFLRKMHTEAKQLVNTLVAEEHDEHIVDLYMEETLKLLDAANAVKKGAARLERLVMELQVLWKHLEVDGNVSKRKKALESCKLSFSTLGLENKELNKVVELMLNFGEGQEHHGVVTSFVSSWQFCNAFISKLLVWGLLNEDAGVKPEKSKAPCLDAILLMINKRLNKGAAKDGGERNVVLWELHRIYSIVSSLEQSEDKQLLLEGKKCTQELKQGLEKFSLNLSDLFEELIEGRNSVLGILNEQP